MSEYFHVPNPEKLEKITFLLIAFDEDNEDDDDPKVLKMYVVMAQRISGGGHLMNSRAVKSVCSDFAANLGDRLMFRVIPAPASSSKNPVPEHDVCAAITMVQCEKPTDRAVKKRRCEDLDGNSPRDSDIVGVWASLDGALKKIFVNDAGGLRAAKTSVLYEIIRSPSVPKAVAMGLLERSSNTGRL